MSSAANFARDMHRDSRAPPGGIPGYSPSGPSGPLPARCCRPLALRVPPIEGPRLDAEPVAGDCREDRGSFAMGDTAACRGLLPGSPRSFAGDHAVPWRARR